MTQSSDFDSSAVTNLIGLWDFSQGATTHDTGLADGLAQNGEFAGNAYASGGKAYFDGSGDRFDVRGEDATFDGDQGTIEVQFSRAGHVGSDPDTLVNRGEAADAATEGYFNIAVTSNGAVRVTHVANGEEVALTSLSGLAGIGQTVNVKYSWDAETGGQLIVQNLSTGASQTLNHAVTGLDMDIGDNDDERFTFGAREFDDGAYDQYFKGSISHVAVYDSLMPELDGVVEGTVGNDTIDIAYTGDPEGDRIDNNDALSPVGSNDDIVDAGKGDDIVKAGDGNDTVYGGGGSDYLEGGAGNDILYGDSVLGGANQGDTVTAVRESFEWDKAPAQGSTQPVTDNADLDHSFTQNTGSVNVTYTAVTQSSGVDTVYSDTAQNVAGVQGDGTAIDSTSGLSSTTNGQNNYARYELGFSAAVSNVSFNINDIDGDAQVRISAWDANGNPIQVTLTGGSAMQLLNTDGVAGADTADANEGYGDATDAKHTLNVSIAGPVAKISIEHYQNGNDNSGVLVTDVFFDVPQPDPGIPGNDTLIGGMGDDVLYGEDGDDTLEGGSGNDQLFGGDGNDTITGGSGNDYVEGGDGNDIIDTSGPNNTNLPDRGFPSYNGFPAVPADPDGFNDRDTVYGGDGDDTITTGDDNDTIFGGAGNDTIDGGLDDDTIDGGDGNDFIVGGEGSDTIQGGKGDDTIYGGLNPAYPDATNIRDDGSNGQPDPVTDNGKDLIHGGDGNDTIYGQDDDDTIYGDDGDDYIDGGIDDDSLYGGAGNDTIFGGQGNDLLDGGAGNDVLSGGDDRDTFVNVNGGDEVHGGAGFSLSAADDYDTLDLRGSLPAGGSLSINITGPDSDGNGFDGTVDFTDASGNLSTLIFTNIENIIPCFTPGTKIATPQGERLVETLKAGDRIITRDNGFQDIKWIGSTRVDAQRLAGSPHLRPVLIRQCALGNDLPERDMMVSPNHRVLITGDKTALYFEESEVLVAAKHLTGLPGIDIVDVAEITYIHFMFDQHEVVLSDGAWTESFQPGDHSLAGIDADQRREIIELFPELDTTAGLGSYAAARRSLKRYEAQLLLH